MEFIKDLIVSIFMVATVLSIFVGVPLLIFRAHRRELAQMTPAQRAAHIAEEQDDDPEQWVGSYSYFNPYHRDNDP